MNHRKNRGTRCFAPLVVAVLLMLLPAVAAAQQPGPEQAPAAPQDTIQMTLVASGLARPTFVTAAPGDRSRLFIVEKPGRIRIIQNGTLLTTPFLDITALVNDASNEQGLLSMAFHPNYNSNGRFFVYYTDNDSNVAIARYQVSAGDPNLADPASGTIILTQAHPNNTNHNGGQLQFGPDGYLYMGLGDGGGSGDTNNNAQNLGTLLGKQLRIDVNGTGPYTIPPSNPFVNTAGARGEIWSLGLRNPWRFSFDRLNGNLWIGDVGQSAWEEVDLETAGSSGGINWGWRCMEGTHQYNFTGNCPNLTLTPPIYEYSHSSGACAITGGYVYRGSVNSSLFGAYLFADYCRSSLLFTLRNVGGSWVRTDYTLAGPSGTTLSLPSSFGEDAVGDIYVTDDSSSNGEVFKLQLRPAACVAGNYDVNGDGMVSVRDIQLVAGDWQRADYVPDYDVNCSGGVNIVDVQLVAAALSGS